MPGRRWLSRLMLAGALWALAGGVAAFLTPAASANFHLMKIREVSGDSGALNNAYIELQMYSGGQNLVAGHNLSFWDADGLQLGLPAPAQTIPLSGPTPPNAESQRTILVGDTNVTGSDFTMNLTPFFDEDAGANLTPAGAVCFEAIPVDCVSWGAFTGAANLPDGATPVADPLPTDDAHALRRSIAPGCSTLLEAGDDTNLASDFSVVLRSARNNAAPVTETPCPRPNTTINTRPRAKSKDRTPTWTFSSPTAGVGFDCKIDFKPFAPCTSPKTFTVKPGTHSFRVRAKNPNGADLSPAQDRFKVIKKKKRKKGKR